MKGRALFLAIAAQFAAAMAPLHADVGPAPGNALNPSPINPATAGRWMDEEGLGTRIPAARTPTGQLYNIPLDPGVEDDAKDRAAWQFSGFAEFGGLWVRGDDRSAGWRNYKDLRSGAYLNQFTAAAEKPDAARYFEVTGGAAGRRDQFYRAEFGRYNDWKVTAFFDGTPQVFTTTYRSLWNGIGTADLRLASLTPGGTTNAATTQTNILNALAATDVSQLDAIRNKGGVRIDKKLGESWKVYASFVNEKREGAQPFGAVLGGGGGGGNFELAQSIDYDTRDFAAGVQFSDSKSSFNLAASASFFRNNIDTMAFQNPVFITLNGTSGLSPTLFSQGRFDLPPDNEHYNVKAEYARAFPELMRASFTAAVAFGTMRQNDELIAPTGYSLAGGTVTAGGVSLADRWNTTDALGRRSAEARIDTRLVNLGLALRPAGSLDVKAKLRYYETDNAMQYLACNPLTGQWGRLINDGSGLSLVTVNAYNNTHCDLAATRALNLVPSAGNIPIASIPYDYRQVNASVSADYRIGRGSSVNATLEREAFRRSYRERDETWDDKVKLAYVNRGLVEGTLRLSYEHDRRGGSAWDSNPYLQYFSASLGPTPTANNVAAQSWFHTIEQFRSFDIADRRQDILNARVNHAFHATFDGAMTLQVKDAQYPAQLGRTGHQRSGSATFDLNYQAGSKAEVYGFYSFQASTLDQKGVHPNSCVIGNTYYFFSDGSVAAAVTGAAAPAAPAGTTLVATQNVSAGNWISVCSAAAATSPLFPDSRGWEVDSKDRNHVVGLGVKYDFGRAKLDTSFTRTLGRTRIGYAYNPAGLGLTAVQAALAGSGLSDLTFAQSVINATLLVPINKQIALRILLRHEMGRIRDWHSDAVAINPMPTNNAVYLDGGPQDYRNTAVGLFIQVRL